MSAPPPSPLWLGAQPPLLQSLPPLPPPASARAGHTPASPAAAAAAAKDRAVVAGGSGSSPLPRLTPADFAYGSLLGEGSYARVMHVRPLAAAPAPAAARAASPAPSRRVQESPCLASVCRWHIASSRAVCRLAPTSVPPSRPFFLAAARATAPLAAAAARRHSRRATLR